MSGSAPDPQAALIDRLSDNQLLDAVCPPDTSVPALVKSKSAHCLLTQSVEDLRADESLAGELRWVVHGLVPEDAFVIVFGGPKVGKGTLVTNLTKRVISAESFLGRAVAPGNVLWLDLEQTRWLTRRKFEEEDAYGKVHRVYIYNGVPPKLVDIEETILQLRPRLVVIDSLSRLLLLEDENSAAEVTAALDPIVQIAHRTHTAIVAIHHARKSEGPHGSGMRGSSAFLAVSDVALEVKFHGDKTDDTRRKVVGIGRYDETNETIIVRRVDDGYVVEESPSQKRRQELLHLLRGPTLTIDELATKLGTRKSTVQEDLKILIAADKIVRLTESKRGIPQRFHVL